MMNRITIIEAFENYAADNGQEDSLVGEFFETLIMDETMSEKMKKQIWTLVTTPAGVEGVVGGGCEAPLLEAGSQQRPWVMDRLKEICYDVVSDFVLSEDETSLNDLWQATIDKWWPTTPQCMLKTQIDAMTN